jgi:hypothetical protein
MFYHPFLSKETKKLIDMVRFYLICSSFSSSVPNAVPSTKVFLSWNLQIMMNVYLTVPLTSWILDWMDSFSPMAIGNLPILTKMFPSNLGISYPLKICLYLHQGFWCDQYVEWLTPLLDLLLFLVELSETFSVNTLNSQSCGLFFSWMINSSIPQWFKLPMTPMEILGWGTLGKRTAPLNLLSFSGS